ncbi:MAG: radical SAM protein [Candidatus Rokubacteria bacterium]|nr:radical SAM protein [Candidatus Rokubacteria bacterium]
MARVLLINPSYKETYTNSMARLCVPFYPVLSLATVIPKVKEAGHQVQVIDLCYEGFDLPLIMERVRAWKPDVVGLTGTTPLFSQVRTIARAVKAHEPAIVTVGGGAHCSAIPEQSLEEAGFDYVCYGEGDFSLADIVDGKNPAGIAGIVYRDGAAKIVRNPPNPWLQNLDDLPFPSWEEFDLAQYEKYWSRLIARRKPVTFFETTRGCVFACNYCGSKNTVGRTFRKKSVERVVDEIKYGRRHGFREFYLVDDIFTTDVPRAKAICEAIIRQDLDVAWSCTNGIRVDAGDQEMFDLMARAGCYKVAFGFESGDNRVLKEFGKGGRATVEAARSTVAMARRAGIDVFGFFMVGLLQDTEETMAKTIDLGRHLETDILKISVCIPFPGTRMYDELKAKGLLKDFDWDKYNVYNPQRLYTHPTLSWETIERYYTLAYRRMILTNPSFYYRRLRHGLRSGEFAYDAYYFLRFVLAGGKI